MDMPVNVEVNPNEDTEWNDILRKHGIIPEKPPSPTPMIQEALLEGRRLAHENRLEGKNVDELDELEDEEDEAFLAQYRDRRMTEMNTISQTSIYNQVFHLQKPDYGRDVTEASKKSWVFVLLTSSLGNNTESQLLDGLWPGLARRFGDVKFCQMRANLCIEGYPDKNTPTVLVYKNGDIMKQIVTLREMRGTQTTEDDIGKLLVELGALQQTDIRLQKRNDYNAPPDTGKLRTGTLNRDHDDDGDDWD